MKQEAPARTEHLTEYLSTVEVLNPLRVLEQFGSGPVVLCAVAVWTRQTMTGNLDEKGVWVRSFWEAVVKTVPEAAGCRLGWNTLFFALPNENLTLTVKQFSDLLQSRHDVCLTSFCVLCEVSGKPQHKLDVLDVLGHEVGTERNFGTSQEYRPNGYRFYHLLDGKPFSMK